MTLSTAGCKTLALWELLSLSTENLQFQTVKQGFQRREMSFVKLRLSTLAPRSLGPMQPPFLSTVSPGWTEFYECFEALGDWVLWVNYRLSSVCRSRLRREMSSTA
jgi:hypothetical protein